VAEAVMYRFQLASDAAFGSMLVDITLGSTSYTSAPIPAGTYFWRVMAIDAAGNVNSPAGPFTFTATGPSVGTLTVALGPGSPLASNEINTAQNLPILQLRLSASAAEDVQITSLTITALGSGNDAAHLSEVRLAFDANSDGAFDPAVDTSLGTAAGFPLDNGTLTFPGLNLFVPASQSRDVLVVYSLNGTAPIGGTFAGRLASTTHVDARGMTSGQTLLAQGTFPVDGSTLTIVFSDIESSTQMAVALGDKAWFDLLRRHHELVSAHVSAHRGRIVKNQGDGYMLCFRSARGAILAAIGIQRDLTRHGEAFPDQTTRVRMGLHTGEVLAGDDGDLFGKHVVIAARIGALADGAEVLVSSLVRQIVEPRGDLVFISPREVELRGLGAIETLYAVDWHAFPRGERP
jgi:class 3 adenylate cyclase